MQASSKDVSFPRSASRTDIDIIIRAARARHAREAARQILVYVSGLKQLWLTAVEHLEPHGNSSQIDARLNRAMSLIEAEREVRLGVQGAGNLMQVR